MKKFKKITATILTIALLASVAVITASALGGPVQYIYDEEDLIKACEIGGIYDLANDIETDENFFIDGEGSEMEGGFYLALGGRQTITFTGEGTLFTVSERSNLFLNDITFNKSNKNTDYCIFDSYINNEGNTTCSNVNFYNGETAVENTNYASFQNCNFKNNITAIYNNEFGNIIMFECRVDENDRGIMNFALMESSCSNFSTNCLAVHNLGTFISTDDMFYNNNTAVYSATCLELEGDFVNEDANITITESIFYMNYMGIDNNAKATITKADITYNEIGVSGLTRADLRDSIVKFNLVNIDGAMPEFLERIHSIFVSIIWKVMA